jgi:hypothetical protein
MPGYLGGRRLRHVSRRPAGWNRRRRSTAEALGGGPAGPALVRRRERLALRAALNPYRKSSQGRDNGTVPSRDMLDSRVSPDA